MKVTRQPQQTISTIYNGYIKNSYNSIIKLGRRSKQAFHKGIYTNVSKCRKKGSVSL